MEYILRSGAREWPPRNPQRGEAGLPRTGCHPLAILSSFLLVTKSRRNTFAMAPVTRGRYVTARDDTVRDTRVGLLHRAFDLRCGNDFLQRNVIPGFDWSATASYWTKISYFNIKQRSNCGNYVVSPKRFSRTSFVVTITTWRYKIFHFSPEFSWTRLDFTIQVGTRVIVFVCFRLCVVT